MADLYTSLVRAKQELNGGVLPAMTPVPERLHHIIDPGFTIGMGALREDPDKGLQCPVRGCGVWRHNLASHMSRQHRNLGAARIKRLLSIPPNAPLASASYRAAGRERARRRGFGTTIKHAGCAGCNKRGGRGTATIGYRNFRNNCEAQLRQRLLSLREDLGRAPSLREARLLDGAMVSAGLRLFGTWNNFLGQNDLPIRPDRKWTLDATLDAFRAWYDEHGSLPSEDTADRRGRTPLVPVPQTVKRVLGDARWSECMRRIASLLNIYGGRYGLPPAA